MLRREAGFEADGLGDIEGIFRTQGEARRSADELRYKRLFWNTSVLEAGVRFVASLIVYGVPTPVG
jgi:hypothetical protein